MRKLTVKSGPAAGRSVPIDGEVVIGRADADLTIEDTEISRRHAIVRPVDGGVQIEDLGSTNGTFVDGERLTGPLTVSGAASMEVGDSLIAVELEEEDVAPKAAAPSGPRSRMAIAAGVVVAVAAIAALAIVLFLGESEETEARTLDARVSLPSLADPGSFQISGVMTGEPLGRTAVVAQRRLGGNLEPGGPPASVRGFFIVTSPSGNLSLNFNGELALDDSGRERIDARGVAANGTQEYAGAEGTFRMSGGAPTTEARVGTYRIEGELDY